MDYILIDTPGQIEAFTQRGPASRSLVGKQLVQATPRGIALQNAVEERYLGRRAQQSCSHFAVLLRRPGEVPVVSQ